MATLTATRAASGFPVFKPSGAGVLGVSYGTYTLAANPTAADVIEFCRIPKGAVVLFGFVTGADIDTGTETLDIDIGWAANGVEAADPDGFGNLGINVWTGDAVTGWKETVGVHFPLQGVLQTSGPQTFSAETTIIGTVVAAAAAGGTGAITVTVCYVVP